MDDFLINAVMAAFGISIGSAPLGSFILWRRLSYFGDTISHAAMLGITISVMMHIHHIWGILLISLLPLLVLIKLPHGYAKDMSLNIISNSSVALSVIILSMNYVSSASIMSMLFGDILTVNHHDIVSIYCAAIVIVLVTFLRWKKWLFMTINKDLAQVANLNTTLMQVEFIILLSVFIAIGINVVGILLINSLLIIPAATARILVNNPLQMILLSSGICFIASILGLLTSLQFDFPTGASIIVVATLFLILANCFSYIRNYK